MNAEERALMAIEYTRNRLRDILLNPIVLIYIATYDIGPDDIEDVVTEILEYLDKTGEEEKPHKPEGKIIQEALRLLDDWEKAGLGDYIVNGKYVDALRAKLEEMPRG